MPRLELIERSPNMLLAAYYLARCGDRARNLPSMPPRKLGAKTWKSAYGRFFDKTADGRSQRRFENSIKNARDTFDVLFDNNRMGWVDRDGGRGVMPPRFSEMHDEWNSRSDEELEREVFRLLAEDSTTSPLGDDAARRRGAKAG